jgi:hypothetical protein
MNKKLANRQKINPAIQLPPGVKPSTEKISAKMLQELMDDVGIASGGTHRVTLRVKK